MKDNNFKEPDTLDDRAIQEVAFIWGTSTNFSMRLTGGAMIGLIDGKPMLGWQVKDKKALISELQLQANMYRQFAERLDAFNAAYINS